MSDLKGAAAMMPGRNSYDQLTADLVEAKAEIERLRGLVKSAYEEGYIEGYARGIDDGHPLGGKSKDLDGDWACSDTIELLEKTDENDTTTSR